ncbi:hypothetical protein V6N12_010591 [Hibiscus sabdariffa]|uniref:Uncharacterized protein n=1 Tax=Hibiscus sabdariffa TaxID=183260 RepID=A0ABR2EKJ2_9ROSI
MLKMLIRIHELQVETLCSTMNVDRDSRASSRNSWLHQEMLKMLGFTSLKSKLLAPPGNVEDVGKDS